MSETVILVHGLFTHGVVMLPLALQLRLHGFAAHTFTYFTRSQSPAQNAQALQKFCARYADAPRLHIVAHSLGGVVVRHLAEQGLPANFGRAVTLGTPHQFSSAAQILARFPAAREILDKSLERGLLGGAPPWPINREIGSLAGNESAGLGTVLPNLPSPNDGTVAVAETQLSGQTDHIVLKVSHTAMLVSLPVARAVVSFLRTGRFAPTTR